MGNKESSRNWLGGTRMKKGAVNLPTDADDTSCTQLINASGIKLQRINPTGHVFGQRTPLYGVAETQETRSKA